MRQSGRGRVLGAVMGVMAVFGPVAHADLVLSAPPRESREAGEKLYGALAEYLSKATGERIVYRHPDNWGIYQAYMTKGEYDLVFDGPHFVSWRMARLQHVPIAALDGKLRFVVVSKTDNTRVHQLNDLIGKGVCGHAPPNLATLTLFDQFTNPSRQPLLVETKGFDNAYQALLSGRCVGTVLPAELYRKYDGQAKHTRVLYESTAVSNQALTAGPRVSAEVRKRLQQALLSTEGKPVVQPVAESAGASIFIAVTDADYRGYDSLLRNVWGFEQH